MGMELKNEPWLLEIIEGFDATCKKVDEKIDKNQKQLKECKKRCEQETRFAQELKLNQELTQQLAELTQRATEMDRVCEAFKSRLTISDGDKNRLEIAKEAYEIAKELTGIRFDFSAPPNVAKGYIKSSSRRLLQPFEFENPDSEALWDLMRTAFPNPLENENKT